MLLGTGPGLNRPEPFLVREIPVLFILREPRIYARKHIERQHMKKSISAFAMVAAALAMLASNAGASTGTSHHKYARHSHKAHAATHHRHGAYRHRGYSCPGPRYGYRFGFSTYAGDPFYSDDYFDGRRCYYLHHQDFCRGRKSLEWLRW